MNGDLSLIHIVWAIAFTVTAIALVVGYIVANRRP